MNCQRCDAKATKSGKDRTGNQRYRCAICNVTFIEPIERPLGEMILAEEKALSVLQHIVEGCSIRTTSRITGVHPRTIQNLLTMVGEKCDRITAERIQGLPVKDVQCDEIWGFVGMKEKTKVRKGETSDSIGDAWTFVAFERHTKMVLAWHLGRRTETDTIIFTDKLAHATTGRFQVTTDGFKPYQHAVVMSLGVQHVDFAQLVKLYSNTPEGPQTRYSPADCTGAKKVPIYGSPDPAKVCTSHVERQNLNIRMGMRRMTRLTNAFSKKWGKLYSTLAVFFAYHNFCRVHSSLRVTPAMEAGITNHIWTLKELLTA